MNLIIIQPGATFAIQHIFPEQPLDTIKDIDAPIKYETIMTKLDSVFVAGDISYRTGYCEQTDITFRSRILQSGE